MSRPLLSLLVALFVSVAPALAPAQAPTGGPAFWTVSRGASKVYILGTPALTPKGLAWDTRGLDERLRGASALILPATQSSTP